MDLLEELAHEFIFQTRGMSSVLNRETGEILLDAPESITGEPELDWDDDSSGELLPLPQITSKEAFELRKMFANGQEGVSKKLLLNALDKRKPFRHFTIELERLGLIENWNEYEDQYAIERISDWLKEHGISLDELVEGE